MGEGGAVRRPRFDLAFTHPTVTAVNTLAVIRRPDDAGPAI